MHKGSSLFGNHTAKKVVRVVVRHSNLSPLSPAGGWSSFFKTTSLKKLWPHPQHSRWGMGGWKTAAGGYIWLGLLMHKGSSLFGNHTAKKVVRVVVRHSNLSPLSPAGGWSSFFKTTSLKKLWPHPQHSDFSVSTMAKEKLHNTTAHCPVACHLLILSNVWHRLPIGA